MNWKYNQIFGAPGKLNQVTFLLEVLLTYFKVITGQEVLMNIFLTESKPWSYELGTKFRLHFIMNIKCIFPSSGYHHNNTEI